MQGIEPRTFVFEKENRTHCAIKIKKYIFFPDIYLINTQMDVIFALFFARWAINLMIGAWIEVKFV